jgi:xanthine dehydrogenase accessory factor
MVMGVLPVILLKGAGDLGSGVAYRLHQSGYLVMMTELPRPLLVRRMVSFGNAVWTDDGYMHLEGITARHLPGEVTETALKACLQAGMIPILTAPFSPTAWPAIEFQAVVDVRMAKRNIDTHPNEAPLVIALGPGFTAGVDCHAVIETNRGHHLGRVIWQGSAEPNTGIPGDVKGQAASRVLRAPCAGHVTGHFAIGDVVPAGATIASVEGQAVVAPFDGVLRGLIHPAVEVWPGLKIGDLDPRGTMEHCFTISDKALAIAGGVLEALLARRLLPTVQVFG